MNNSVVLKQGKEVSLSRRHPWIFSGAVKETVGDLQEGDTVRVLDSRGKFLAVGHWQNGSIAIRVLSFEDKPVDGQFWHDRIREAASLRRQLRLPSGENTVFRLIFGEGDLLPGLVIDWYDGNAVVQSHSIGMHNCRHEISEALQKAFKQSLKTIYYKSADTLPRSIKVQNEFLLGSEESCTVREHGHVFEVNWVTGQKTGFFVDQRENRKLLAFYSKGKSVLNTFCYSGGFSVYAARAGAERVDSVDSSEKAVMLTEKNMALNMPDGYQGAAYKADTFDFMKENSLAYDIIILDPPAFAKHKDVRHQALMGYKRLNEQAFRRIRPGGLLFTFSCSQVVDRQLFENTVRAAAIEAGREVSVLHYLTQPPDHPVNIFHPEGDYLKGLVLKIGRSKTQES